MGEWKSVYHSGGWKWLSKTHCISCRIKADCVRPVHLWGTNRYWPKVTGNANQLVNSTTSCWETWLPFSARHGAAALSSRCPHVSQRALSKQMDLAALAKMTRCSASVPRDHRTWPFVTFFRARLSHQCLPSNKRGAHWVRVCGNTWNSMSLRNCSHQFCKNIQ